MKTTKKMLLAIAGLFAGAAFLALTTAPAHADSPGAPGRNATFASATAVYVPTCCQTPPPMVASGTILFGKRRHVLGIDAMLTRLGGEPSTSNPFIYVTVNGVRLEPNIVTTSCPSMDCTLSVPFFLDIDEAEARYPGVFRGKPLVIALHASTYGAPFTAEAVVLRARLERR